MNGVATMVWKGGFQRRTKRGITEEGRRESKSERESDRNSREERERYKN